MWRLVGVVCSAVYVVFLCSHSAKVLHNGLKYIVYHGLCGLHGDGSIASILVTLRLVIIRPLWSSLKASNATYNLRYLCKTCLIE